MPSPRRRPSAWFLPLAWTVLAVASAAPTTSVIALNSTLSASSLPSNSSTTATSGGASVNGTRGRRPTSQTTPGVVNATSIALDVADFAANATTRSVNLGGLGGATRTAGPGRLVAVETGAVDVDVSVEAEVDEETTRRGGKTSTSAANRTSSTLSSSSTTTRIRSTITSTRNSTSTLSRSTTHANSTVSATSTGRNRTTSSTRSTTTTRPRSSTITSRSQTRTTTTRRAKTTTTSKAAATSRKSTSKSATKTKSSSPTQTDLSEKHKKPSSSSPSPKLSPTSYGSASSSRSCVSPPSSFAGTNAGFASLCTVRYCDAKKTRNMAWEGNNGEVTRNEIETALGMLGNVEPVWKNGQGNILSDGKVGQGLENAGLLFEITGDIRALDVVVRIADNILALQNQNSPDPVKIWTGDVDPVWPTGDLYPTDGSLVYAGCESGLIAGHMVSAAVMILKSPCLYDMVPPVFRGPTSFNDSVTYYDRAMAYIAAGDDIAENYFFRFLTPSLSIIQPADERWFATGDTRDPGTPMPWNRRMMMMKLYLRLAAAHETEAAYDQNRTIYYDRIVQRNVADFLAELNETKAIRNGVTTFDWNYSAGEEHTEESQGVHAYFDIWGSWIAWQRNSAIFGLSNYIGQTFANTFENTISFGNGSFSGLVTGSSTQKAYSISTLWGGWSFYGLWLPEWYDTLATANSEVGFGGRTWLAIPLLWTKHALATDDLTFWTGRFSSGFGIVSGTAAPESSSSTSGASPSRLLSPFFTVALASLVAGAVAIAALS
ncbi:hypothetical protein JCM6882_007553 [Rhodosporidiobolus microsporus]